MISSFHWPTSVYARISLYVHVTSNEREPPWHPGSPYLYERVPQVCKWINLYMALNYNLILTHPLFLELSILGTSRNKLPLWRHFKASRGVSFMFLDLIGSTELSNFFILIKKLMFLVVYHMPILGTPKNIVKCM